MLAFYFVPTRVGWGWGLLICARFSSRHCVPTRVGGLSFISYLPASGGGVAPTNLCSLFFTPLRAHPRRGLAFYFVPTRVWGGWRLVFYFVPTRVWGGVAPANLCSFSSRHCVPTRVWEEGACLLLRAYPRRGGRACLLLRTHPRRGGGWGYRYIVCESVFSFLPPPTIAGCHYRTSEIYCVTARAAKERRASGRASLRHLRQE